jgi:hypothetical protein
VIHKRLKQTDELLGDMITGAEDILMEQFVELVRRVENPGTGEKGRES